MNRFSNMISKVPVSLYNMIFSYTQNLKFRGQSMTDSGEEFKVFNGINSNKDLEDDDNDISLNNIMLIVICLLIFSFIVRVIDNRDQDDKEDTKGNE